MRHKYYCPLAVRTIGAAKVQGKANKKQYIILTGHGARAQHESVESVSSCMFHFIVSELVEYTCTALSIKVISE